MAIAISSQGFKRYFANTSWLMAERIFRMAVALFVGVYVARYLGPEQFGLLSYASSFVGLFTALATLLGVNNIMVRELVKTPKRRDELLGTAFWLKAGSTILVWMGIAAAIPFTHNNAQTNTMIIIIAFALVFQAFNVIDINYQAEVKSKYMVYAQFVQITVSSVIKLVFIVIKAPLIYFAWVFLIDAVVLAIGLVAMYLKNTGKVWYWKWSWKTAEELLSDSWPLILSGIAITIYMKIDQVMIKEMLGAEEVGYYAAAVRLSEAWYFIPIAITSSVFPSIINAKKQGEKLYYQRLQKLYNLMAWLAAAIALPTTFLAPLIIKVLFGEAFLPASGVLSIHIWAGVFVFLGVACSKWFILENYIKKNLYRASIGMISNVILNIILIPLYGIYGAAVATLIGHVAANLAYDFFDKQTYPSLKLKINALNPFYFLKCLC
jgi:O-antigen/teichoic acid export membrane protein